MSKKQALLNKLSQLVEHAEEQNRLYLRSRESLWRGLIGVYLWWREAKVLEGFLEECYAQHNIVGRLRDGEENFTRVLRLVWRMDWNAPSAANLQQWSLALRKIDNEFETNKAAYRANAEEKLYAYIDKEGGVRGLIGIRDDVQEASDSEAPAKRKKSRPNPDDEAAIFKKHLELGELYFAQSSKPVASIEIDPIEVGDKDYALALIKRRAANKYDVLATVSDQELVNAAIARGYKRDRRAAPAVLAQLSEVISTQSLPLAIERHRSSLLDTSSIKADDGSKMKQYKRLLFRAKQGDMLLSENRTACSVVTVATPLVASPIKSSKDVFLSVSDRKYIEQSIIQKRDLSLYIANSDDKVPAVRGIAASHKLLVENRATGKVRGLYCYAIDSIGEPSRGQANISTTRVKPVWTAKVDRLWIERLFVMFVAPWLRGYGDQFNRPNRMVMRFDFTPRQLLIWHHGENGNLTIPSPKFDVGANAGSQGCKLHLLSKDVLPVLCGLAEMPTQGKLDIAVAEDYLSITCKTADAKYSIFIPAATPSGKRVGTAFETYGSAYGN